MSFIAAFLTCGMPDLARSMMSQFEPYEPLVLCDNGGVPVVSTAEYGVTLRSSYNRKWSPGFNYFMDRIFRLWPSAQAIWLCNDDITGINPVMGRELYASLMAHDLGVISPALVGAHEAMRPLFTGLADTTFIDFCCPMISRKAWYRVGPLDESFLGWGADMDWCIRAEKLGIRLCRDDRYVVNHEHHGSTMRAKNVIADHEYADWYERLEKKHDLPKDNWVYTQPMVAS